MSTNDFRQCLGKFATGVTVVTCHGVAGPCGITANSFSSVSLEPPLVLWNIAKVSNSLQVFLDAEYFAINILGADQQALSLHFAEPDHTRFNGIEYKTSAKDVPLLPDTVACLECRTHQIYDSGTITLSSAKSKTTDQTTPSHCCSTLANTHASATKRANSKFFASDRSYG